MLGLLRRNPKLRRMWTAQVVSQSGDWLNRIAILTLIANLGGANLGGADLGGAELGAAEATVGLGAMYAIELAVRFLPAAIIGPILAGPIADRFSRRAILIGADVVRAVVVLGFLFVDEPSEIPLLYGLLIAQMAMAVFAEAARSAALPNVVRREDLHAAYSLNAATWSVMLSVGALFGGILVGQVGVHNVFLIDAASYAVSAGVLFGLRLPPPPQQAEPFRWRDLIFYRDARRGLRHVRELGITTMLATKTFWGACGGFLVMLSVVGTVRFDTGDPSDEGFATGVLFAARGVGTGIGPILGRLCFGTEDDALRRQISLSFGVACAGYALFAVADHLALAAFFVVVAHMGGSTLWVSSTTYWQRHVSDAYRGRVYTLEFLGVTFTFSLAGLLAGAVYDRTASIETTVWVVCALVGILGLIWTLLARGVTSPGSRGPASGLLPNTEDSAA